jgi:hypothetical protein
MADLERSRVLYLADDRKQESLDESPHSAIDSRPNKSLTVLMTLAYLSHRFEPEKLSTWVSP